MKISVLGTGMVGQTIAQKMYQLGHEVFMGTRDPEATKSNQTPNPMTGISFVEWYKKNPQINVVNYKDLPAESGFFINATNGFGSLEALKMVGSHKLEGKVILDIANPLDFSKGMPPSLFICNTDSLGEQIQREFPNAEIDTITMYLSARNQEMYERISNDGSDFSSRRSFGNYEWQ